MITQEQAYNLKRGDTLYLDGSLNPDGSLAMWRVLGSQNPMPKGGICQIQTAQHGTGVLTEAMLSRVTLGPAFSDVALDEEAALEPIKKLIKDVAKEKQPRQPKPKDGESKRLSWAERKKLKDAEQEAEKEQEPEPPAEIESHEPDAPLDQVDYDPEAPNVEGGSE